MNWFCHFLTLLGYYYVQMCSKCCNRRQKVNVILFSSCFSFVSCGVSLQFWGVVGSEPVKWTFHRAWIIEESRKSRLRKLWELYLHVSVPCIFSFFFSYKLCITKLFFLWWLSIFIHLSFVFRFTSWHYVTLIVMQLRILKSEKCINRWNTSLDKTILF